LRILSLDGGGYLGLATAAFLEEVEGHFGTRCHDQFDLFCGTSTGAIIAAAFATGMTGRDVRELYCRFGPAVFPSRGAIGRSFRWLRGLVMARYSNLPLVQALNGAFGDATLGDVKQRGKYLLINAFSITNGKPRVFKTNHSPDLTTDDGLLLRDVVLASAAAPVLLPVVTLSDTRTGVAERYCDGGIFANHPALIALAEATFQLKCPPSHVRLLSVSTPRTDRAERGQTRSRVQQLMLSRGFVMWASKLGGMMIDATSEIADTTLTRIASSMGAFYERVTLARPLGTGIDIATADATAALRQLGTASARRADMRGRLSTFFVRE